MISMDEARCYLFDLDGCIWRGSTLAPGADELVAALRSRRRAVYFLSNISGASSATVAGKLTRLGIPANAGEVVVPLRVVDRHPALAECRAAMVIGTSAVREHIEAAGVPVVNDPDAAGVVVVGRDAAMTYAQLAAAARALDRGARLLALNLDLRVPDGEGRYAPGTGSIVAALTAATGAVPELVGKPSPFYFRAALQLFGVEAADAVMIGDSLDSDVAGGAGAGLTTVLVGDGTGQETARVRPDLQVADIRELHRRLVVAGSSHGAHSAD